MFDKFFRPKKADDGIVERPAPPPPSDGAGDTATVRRIVAKLEAMPPDQARFLAAAAYTLARAANADLDISDEETAAIERELQDQRVDRRGDRGPRDRDGQAPGEDRRRHRGLRGDPRVQELADEAQRVAVVRACFAVMAANGTISAEETAVINQIAEELDIDEDVLRSIRADYHEKFSAVQQIRRVTQGS